MARSTCYISITSFPKMTSGGSSLGLEAPEVSPLSRPLSKLCATCTTAFQGLTEDSYGFNRRFTVEGQSMEKFRQAVKDQCFICYRVWRSDISMLPKSLRHLTKKCWRPLTYYFEKPLEEEEPLMKAIVYFGDLGGGFLHPDQFYATPSFVGYHWKGKHAQRCFPQISLERNTSSQRSLDQAHSWYIDCMMNHVGCRQLPASEPGWLPTRLIDIGLPGEAQWRLRITSKDIHSFHDTRYMTLGYRWGSKKQSLMLSSDNLESFCRGKPIAELPQTFKDSIIVARHFGIRYLWIDCLCIIQEINSSDASGQSNDDWKTEAPMMSHVYTNSTCNIAASDSRSPNGGLFRYRDPADILPGLLETNFASPIGLERYFIVDGDYLKQKILDAPLHNRGWVFQERLLSPRTLYFVSDQIMWECFEEEKSESLPTRLHHRKLTKDIDRLKVVISAKRSHEPQTAPKTLELWNELVQNYSSCNFTKPQDKLYAFAGIAKTFQRVTSDTYLGGVWRSRVIEQLDWEAMSDAEPKMKPRASSWSWASANGTVRMDQSYEATREDVEIFPQFVDAGGIWEPTSTMADVSNCFLKLKSHVVRAVYQRIAMSSWRIAMMDGPRVSFTGDITWDSDHRILSMERSTASLMLLRGTWYAAGDSRGQHYVLKCLVIIPVGERPGYYQRAGLLTKWLPEEEMAEEGWILRWVAHMRQVQRHHITLI